MTDISDPVWEMVKALRGAMGIDASKLVVYKVDGAPYQIGFIADDKSDGQESFLNYSPHIDSYSPHTLLGVIQEAKIPDIVVESHIDQTSPQILNQSAAQFDENMKEAYWNHLLLSQDLSEQHREPL